MTSPLRARGSNPSGLGQFNERVVLQTIRLHGSISKADIARLTHLSAQAVASIVARLSDMGLVIRRSPVRGKVGQPSVPMALNPDGAFSIGVKIGRRALDVQLVDFVGHPRERLLLDYGFAEPDAVFGALQGFVAELRCRLVARQASLGGRLHGIGIAAPLSLGGWRALLDVEEDTARRWSGIDIRERVHAVTGLPVELVKDTAAACLAELVIGIGRGLRDFLYVFVDTFVGGSLVLDGHLRSGRHGNAGGLHALPLGVAAATGTPPAQVLSVASLFSLEEQYRLHGLDSSAVLDARAMQPPWRPHTLAWLGPASRAIAFVVLSTVCVLDLEDVVLDGSFDPALRAAMLEHLEAAMRGYEWEGVARARLRAGTIGADAGVIGGALLPLYPYFAPNPRTHSGLEAFASVPPFSPVDLPPVGAGAVV